MRFVVRGDHQNGSLCKRRSRPALFTLGSPHLEFPLVIPILLGSDGSLRVLGVKAQCAKYSNITYLCNDPYTVGNHSSSAPDSPQR